MGNFKKTQGTSFLFLLFCLIEPSFNEALALPKQKWVDNFSRTFPKMACSSEEKWSRCLQKISSKCEHELALIVPKCLHKLPLPADIELFTEGSLLGATAGDCVIKEFTDRFKKSNKGADNCLIE